MTTRYINTPRITFGRIEASGVSQWDVQIGRLTHPRSRITYFNTCADMVKWAKRYGIDCSKEIEAWNELEKK